MFKVLVIAYYFPPMGLSGVQRTLKFVKYMSRYNWQPTVLTTENIAYYAHDHSLVKELENENVRIIRTEANDPNSLLSKYGTVKIPSEFFRRLLNRISQTIFIPDNKKSWSKKAYVIAEKLLTDEKFDAVFITAPPFSSFNIGVRLKKKFRIPLFLDYRDLWYDSYFAFYLTPFHKIRHKQKEYSALKAADKIFVTNRKIKEKMIKYHKFLSFEDVIILSHGYDTADFENAVVLPKITDKMILTYSGIFVEYATPYYFLHAFKKLLIERPDIGNRIELRFIGLLRKENRSLIKKLNLEEYIKDYGYLDHKEAVSKLLESDVLWFMIEYRRNIDAILPGKVYEYFGSKKPVIAMVPEGAARISASEYGAAFITEPNNIEQIKDTLLKVFDLYLKKELPVPDDDYIEKYRRDYLTEQLVKHFQFYIKSDVI